MTELWEILFGQKSPSPLSLLPSRPFSLSPLSRLFCGSAGQNQNSTWSVPAQSHCWMGLHMAEPPLPMLSPVHLSAWVTMEPPGAPVNKLEVSQWPHSPQTLVYAQAFD